MPIRNYSSGAVKARLTSRLLATDTAATVDQVTGWPAAPFTVILGRDGATEEVATCTEITGLSIRLTRGEDGTAALTHEIGETVEHGVSARDFREANSHVNAVGGVHGVIGDLVGTEDQQVVQNKVFTSTDGSRPGLIARQGGASSGQLFDVQTAAGTSVAGFDVTGKLKAAGGLVSGQLRVVSNGANTIPLVVVGDPSQSEDLINVQTAGGGVGFRVDAAGNAYAPNLTQDTLNATNIFATNMTATGLLKGANVQATGQVSGSGATFSGTVQGGFLNVANNISAGGNLAVEGSITYKGGQQIPRMSAGRATVSLANANSTFTTVTFPAGRFSQAPVVTCTVATGPAGGAKINVRALNATTGGFSLYGMTADGALLTATVTVNWIAVQMTDGSATG